MLPQEPYRDASYRTEERVAHSYSVPDWPPGSRGDALARTFLPWCRSEADHGGVPTVSRFLLVLGPERCRSKERARSGSLGSDMAAPGHAGQVVAERYAGRLVPPSDRTRSSAAVRTGRGAAWSAHLLWDYLRISAVLSSIFALQA